MGEVAALLELREGQMIGGNFLDGVADQGVVGEGDGGQGVEGGFRNLFVAVQQGQEQVGDSPESCGLAESAGDAGAYSVVDVVMKYFQQGGTLAGELGIEQAKQLYSALACPGAGAGQQLEEATALLEFLENGFQERVPVIGMSLPDNIAE